MVDEQVILSRRSYDELMDELNALRILEDSLTNSQEKVVDFILRESEFLGDISVYVSVKRLCAEFDVDYDLVSELCKRGKNDGH